MPTRNRLGDLEEWIGRMLACSDGPESESTLLRAVQCCASARAVGLWRELSITDKTRWIETRARGPQELLPTPAQVRAVLEAGLDGEMSAHTRVLRAGPPGSRIALALGGMGPSQSGIDQAEALLALHLDIAPPDARRASSSPALPRRDPVRREHDPLREARSVIAAEAASFASRSIELETRGFDAGELPSGLDEEQLAGLVRALLLRARHSCDGASAGPCRVVLSARVSLSGLSLSLETSAAGALPTAAPPPDCARACVLRAVGTLVMERPSGCFERIRIWLPSSQAG